MVSATRKDEGPRFNLISVCGFIATPMDIEYVVSLAEFKTTTRPCQECIADYEKRKADCP